MAHKRLIASIRRLTSAGRYNRPFVLEPLVYAGDMFGYRLTDANNRHRLRVTFSGNAKQRRQQKRAMLRAVNKEDV